MKRAHDKDIKGIHVYMKYRRPEEWCKIKRVSLNLMTTRWKHCECERGGSDCRQEVERKHSSEGRLSQRTQVMNKVCRVMLYVAL